MKKILYLSICFQICRHLIAFGAYAGDLTVVAHDVNVLREGTMLAALYASPVGYMRPDSQIASIVIGTVNEDSKLTGTFEDLPPGKYVVALLHDEDGDGRMKRGFSGLPLEGYGFSGVKPAPLAPPPFDIIAVEVNSTDQKTVDVYLKYL